MRKLVLAALLLASCGSSSDSKPVTAAPKSDPQLTSIQQSLTELLERLDVMNDRITRLEKAAEERPAVTSPPPVTQTQAQPARRVAAQPPSQNAPTKSANLADTYRNAVALFAQNHYTEARSAFQKVFEADSSSVLADNALFWIGETYFATNDFNNAIRFYKRVTDEYGDQNKAPDAMYKLALSYEKTSDLALARTTLQDVIARYPYSAPAASAKAELNRIKY